MIFDIFDGTAPSLSLPDRASLKVVFDFSDTLFDDLPSTERIMSNLRVSHLSL